MVLRPIQSSELKNLLRADQKDLLTGWTNAEPFYGGLGAAGCISSLKFIPKQ
jgi:hypothetical protein